MGVENEGLWIQTYTGRRFEPEKFTAADVDIRDVAHALSNVCRFGGHCREFYSVAQHCVLASYYVELRWPDDDATPGVVRRDVRLAAMQAALLHDAAEAYLGDIMSPLKRMAEKLCAHEYSINDAVARRFGLAVMLEGPHGQRIREAVREVDRRLLETERGLHLTTELPWVWDADGHRPTPLELTKEDRTPWTPQEAEQRFLERFSHVFGGNLTVHPWPVDVAETRDAAAAKGGAQ
jgi:uncharacterized protein